MAAVCASNIALIASPRSRALKPVVRTGDEWMDDAEEEDEDEDEDDGSNAEEEDEAE